jgi:DNA-directed RNA polymerase subunit alpha
MSRKREYRPLTIPKISWDKKTLTNFFGQLTVQPLEPGFGTTLGNALRRLLLGSVEGSAVTSVIIKGVNNEFSVLPGIQEDIMQILLNIKSIVIKNATGIPGAMRLRAKGESVVTVNDIVSDEHLEFVNKNQIIAHLAKDGELDIQFFVEPGRGYMTAQWPLGKSFQEDGRIYLDASFSPIIRVGYEIEKTRVGFSIDYDKLILTIHTNGAENPVDVLHYVISVLRSQLEHFLKGTEIPFNEISVVVPEEKPVDIEYKKIDLKNVSPDFLLKPIEELELSVRSHNCLLNAGIKRVIELVNVSEEDLLGIKNFGRKSLNEVKDSMKAFGISFSMNISEEDVKRALEIEKNAERKN